MENACLSHFIKDIHSTQEEWKETLRKAPVHIQWDPEKDILLNKLEYRSIQVGLTGIAVEKYVNDWIVSIEDISDKCRKIHSLILDKKIEEANQLLPLENIYPLPDKLKTQILYSS